MIVIDLHLEIFALLYILILCITLLIYKLKKKNKYNIYGLILFELYILCLVKVVYTPVVFNRAMSDDMVEKMKMNYANFVPFRTITGVGSVHNFAVQVGGNILLLMPLVFFLYYVFFIKSYRKCIVYCFMAIVFIEITQYIIDIITKFPNKVCDVDDVILNFIGIILSILIIHLLNNTKIEKGIAKFFDK